MFRCRVMTKEEASQRKAGGGGEQPSEESPEVAYGNLVIGKAMDYVRPYRGAPAAARRRDRIRLLCFVDAPMMRCCSSCGFQKAHVSP